MRLLKEWDIVCRALEDGRQVFLARKGGILDDGGLFVPAYREFYLYPTFLHQSEQFRDYLKPSELAPYHRAFEPPPNVSPQEITVRLFARVADIYKISDLAQLKRMDSEHIWKAGFLEKRFEWGSERSLTLLVVRAYVLDPPASLAVKPSFAGCRSWVEDDGAPPPAILKPVLSEDAFLTRRMRLKRILGK